MSLNILPVNTVRITDKLLDLNSKPIFTVGDYGKEQNYVEFLATNVNNSSINIKCDPPNDKVICDSRLYQKYSFTISYQATNNQLINRRIIDTADGSEFGRPIADAPRQFPIAQITDNVQLKFNSGSVNTELSKYINELLRYSNDLKKLKYDLSMTPTQLDQALNYSDIFNTSRSPFGQYGDNAVQDTRASYFNFAITSNPIIAPAASGTATMTLTVIEPLLCSPFYFSKRGFRLDTMNYNLSISNLDRIMSRSPVNGNIANPPLTLTLINVNVTAASILAKFVTPKDLTVIPKHLIYNYNNIMTYQQDASASLAAGGTAEITMNAMKLSGIPKRVYIYVKEKLQDIVGIAGITKTDAINSKINSVTIGFNNKSGLLSSASREQLYTIARENGLNMSYNEYNKNIGSVLCLSFGKDINLNNDEAPSLLSVPQLSIKVNYTNIATRAINFTCYAVVVYDGVFNALNQVVSTSDAVLNKQDVIRSQMAPNVFVEHSQPKNYMGGFLGLIPEIIRGVRKGVQFVAPIAKKVADFGEAIGLGYKNKRRGRKRGGKMLYDDDLENILADE